MGIDDLLATAGSLINNYRAERNVTIEELHSVSWRRDLSGVRRHLSDKLVNELGLSSAETGRQSGLKASGVAQILRRGDWYS